MEKNKNTKMELQLKWIEKLLKFLIAANRT